MNVIININEKEAQNANCFLRMTSAEIRKQTEILPGEPLFGYTVEMENGSFVEIFVINGEKENEFPHIEAILREKSGKPISALPLIWGVTNIDGLNIVFPDLYQITLKVQDVAKKEG